MSKRKSQWRGAFLAATLLLVFLMVYSGNRIMQSTIFCNEQDTETVHVSKTITRDGVEYFPRQDITVIMALGIDEHGLVQASDSYRNTGEADAIMLVILDQQQEKYSILNLNRDTMVEMPVLGIGGKRAGTFFGQLALSHTYGTGLEDSCENTRSAISDFLYGVTIDHYVSVNMDAVSMINDTVGGVTVLVTDDFSEVDSSIPMGEVTLMGEQAMTYVRSRMDVGNQLNISRMARYEQYVNSLVTALNKKVSESDTFALELYDQIAEYVVTDCSANVISGLMERCADYTLNEIVTPEGENVLGNEYYEFYVDEEKLDELIIRLFYAEK